MIDAIKAEQRTDLLQFALSPRCGREAEGADTGQVAHARKRGADLGALAKGCNAGGLFVGVTAEGVGGIGPKTQGDAVRGSEGRNAAPVARKKVRPRYSGQRRPDLFAGRNGQSCGYRQGSNVGGLVGSVRDMGPRTLPEQIGRASC